MCFAATPSQGVPRAGELLPLPHHSSPTLILGVELRAPCLLFHLSPSAFVFCLDNVLCFCLTSLGPGSSYLYLPSIWDYRSALPRLAPEFLWDSLTGTFPWKVSPLTQIPKILQVKIIITKRTVNHSRGPNFTKKRIGKDLKLSGGKKTKKKQTNEKEYMFTMHHSERYKGESKNHWKSHHLKWIQDSVHSPSKSQWVHPLPQKLAKWS
jgi:hypothetical protein